MSNFHIRVKELRMSRKLSQQELADYLKISKSSVNMYERGEREPGLDMLETIADFFNVDMDYLMGKSNMPHRYLVQSIEKLTVEEQQLITIYKNLNAEGRNQLIEQATNLSELAKYKKESEIKYAYRVAHTKEGKEPPSGEIIPISDELLEKLRNAPESDIE